MWKSWTWIMMCFHGVWCTCFHELSLMFIRSRLFVSTEGERKALSHFGHSELVKNVRRITRCLRNMISLWSLVVEASFGEVVQGSPSVLCVMYVKDGLTMDWPHEIVREMLISCDVSMSLCCLVDYHLIPLTKKLTQTFKGQSQWAKSLKSQFLEIGWPHKGVPIGWIAYLLFLRGMTLSLWSCFHSVDLKISTNARHNHLVRARHCIMVRVYSQQSSNLNCARPLSFGSSSGKRPWCDKLRIYWKYE